MVWLIVVDILKYSVYLFKVVLLEFGFVLVIDQMCGDVLLLGVMWGDFLVMLQVVWDENFGVCIVICIYFEIMVGLCGGYFIVVDLCFQDQFCDMLVLLWVLFCRVSCVYVMLL